MVSGEIDLFGNGQPSIVYKGELNTLKLSFDKPELAGRSNQYSVINKLSESLDSLTTAKKLVKEITVSCK